MQKKVMWKCWYDMHRSLTEIKLITNKSNVFGRFSPSRKIDINEEMPVIFNDNIVVYRWKHFLDVENDSQSILLSNINDKDFVVNNLKRCAVPLDGFIVESHINFYFHEKNGNLFYALAIFDNDNNFDFVVNPANLQLFCNNHVFLPIVIGYDEIFKWEGPDWKNIIDNLQSTIKLEVEEVIISENEFSSSQSFYEFNDLHRSKEELNNMLKTRTPKIIDLML